MSQGCNTKALSAVWVCFSALKVPLQTQTSTGEIVCETSRAGAQVLSSGLHCPPMSDDHSFSCGGAGSRGHPEASVRSAGRPGLLSIIPGAAHGDQDEMVPPLVQLLDPPGQRAWCGRVGAVLSGGAGV